MRSSFLKYVLILSLAAIGLVFQKTTTSALEAVPTVSTINLVVGDIQTLRAHNLTRVSVTDPNIADISDADDTKVSLLARNAGETVLFMWDATGKRTINIRVVRQDLHVIQEHIQKLLNESGIRGVSLQINDDEGRVVMTGSVSRDERTRLERVVSRYNESILNFVREERDQSLIQIDMQIVEISTSLEKNLGIVWGAAGSGNGLVTAATGTATGSATASSTAGGNASSGSSGVSLNYGETIPANATNSRKFTNLFQVGTFSRSSASALNVTVNALLQEGKAKLISKPRLVVVSGRQASFLVGGEIPIVNTTSNSTGTSQTTSTTYAQYGVNLSVSPTIREGKIDVVLNVDIRDIDGAIAGANTAFITRTASTDLLMDNKQTIALAGLIKYSGSTQVTKVPFLSNIPLVGKLFTNIGMPSPDTKTEMVIILTPLILDKEKFADTQVVMPTLRERQEWQNVDSQYEHESLNPLPGAPPAPVAQPVVITPAKAPSPVQSPIVTIVKPPVEKPPAPVAVPPVTPYVAPAIQPAPVAWATPVKSGAPYSQETLMYARAVQQKISTKVLYPPEAIDNGWVGTVKLKLKILKNGTLSAVDVVESSGHAIFDENALRAARLAAPYAVFTAGMTQEALTITLPIVYSRQ